MKSTFWQWLKRQRRREDPVGDIAQEFFADPHLCLLRCKEKHSPAFLRGWLAVASHAAAQRAFERAVREYDCSDMRMC